MLQPRAVLLTAALFFAASCSSAHDDLSRSMLLPAAEWLVEPADLGLDAEAFDLPVGNGSLYGYLIRADKSDGRTVVLFHNSNTNVSMQHPYYTFLVSAGLNVCVFDYRGFGKSKGTASLRGMFLDTKDLLAWLCEQRGVDRNRIAFYGVSIGSVAALRTAVRDYAPRALVLDEVPSPRDFIRERMQKRGEMVSTLGAGFTEFAALPEDCEPAENSAKLSMPSLWITATEAPKEQVTATLRAYYEMGGDKQLWAQAGTSSPPNALLTQDGEYQRAITTFLTTALAGSAERVSATWRPIEVDADGRGRYQIEVTAHGSKPNVDNPWAVQIAALDKDGTPTWAKVWLEGERARITVELPAAPGVVSGTRAFDGARGEAATFERSGTALSRAAKWHNQHAADFVRLGDEPPDPVVARTAAAAIRERETIEPFPQQLEHEMAVVYVGIGRALARTTDAEDRAASIVWLQRGIKAAPAKPERHWWAAARAHFGWRDQDAIADARALLKKLTGE